MSIKSSSAKQQSLPLAPGSTIGIFGGGQLGRMLAMAAAKLGLKTLIYCENTSAPAFAVSDAFICAPYTDQAKIEDFAKAVDIITFEFENIPLHALEAAMAHAPIAPGIKALETSQDRLYEKQFLQKLGIATAPFMELKQTSDKDAALENLTQAFKALHDDHKISAGVLKTRRLGYDGKGQVKLSGEIFDASRADPALNTACEIIAAGSAILEGFVQFEHELSQIIARRNDGSHIAYDVADNEHRNHILHSSTVPSRLSAERAQQAQTIAMHIADALDYVGILAVEFFYCGENASSPLIVNEIAPRVHNSGHWSEAACAISQFENHIRAIAHWPLGSPARHSNAVMTNIIGEDAQNWSHYAAQPGHVLHLYGKDAPKAGRKMGHVTALSPKT